MQYFQLTNTHFPINKSQYSQIPNAVFPINKYSIWYSIYNSQCSIPNKQMQFFELSNKVQYFQLTNLELHPNDNTDVFDNAKNPW
jgi:hypothetical protein